MATPKQIQDALQECSGGGLDVNRLVKEVIKNNLKGNFSNEEDLDKMADSICKDGQSFFYKSAYSKLTQLSGALTTLPGMATSLVTQFTSIPGTVVGMAAPAAAPLIASVMSQAQGLKSQLTQALQTASELGIDLPIDPLLGVLKIIKPLL